jgi:hypothetical protein
MRLPGSIQSISTRMTGEIADNLQRVVDHDTGNAFLVFVRRPGWLQPAAKE